jgi:hypothetical protein
MTAVNPRFADIVALLNTLYANDPNIDESPHGAFWQNVDRNTFVGMRTDDWGVAGMLVGATPQASNLYLALAGTAPFDGSVLSQMPDTAADPKGRHATADELKMVADWITGGAPA